MKLVATLLFLVAAPGLFAQWPLITTAQPNLAAKTPKAKGGKPDLSGLWSIGTEEYWHDIAGVPLTPEAAAIYKQRSENFGKDSPIARCLPAGVPTIDFIPLPFRIVQTPGIIAILYEYNTEYRQIFMDGRVLPKNPNPNWLGYSVGRWDGDTLVVETEGLKDEAWLDQYGHPASDGLHVTERFRRRDFGHLDLEVTMTDPRSFTKPWTIKLQPTLNVKTEIMEWVCLEGNGRVEHLVGKE